MAERAILRAAIEIVRNELGSVLETVVIERVAVGTFFTGVKLSSGHAGACSFPAGHVGDPQIATTTSLFETLKGCPAACLLDGLAEAAGIRRALGIAVLNALAQRAAESRSGGDFDRLEGIDAFAAADIQPNETVVVVGAFTSFLRQLRKAGAKHVVLEKDPALLQPHELPYFRDAGEAAKVVPHADVLIITGATLMNETLGELIAFTRPAARIVVVGPTVTIIPDGFFDCGVDIVAGIRVTDPDAFMNVIESGGAGYQFFGKSATKVVLRRRSSSLGESRLHYSPVRSSLNPI